jgi:hypothetical protein
VDTVAYPLDSGDAIGMGLYTNGNTCIVTANARSGYRFSSWTDNDTIVSTNSSYQFLVTLNRSLVANFIPGPPEIRMSSFSADSHTLEWATNAVTVVLEQATNLVNWTIVNSPVSAAGSNASITLPSLPGPRFYRLRLQ